MKIITKIILLIILALILGSCKKLVPVSTETTTEIKEKTDSVTIIERRDTTFIIERQIATETIDKSRFDSLFRIIRAAKPNQTIVRNDAGRAEVQLLLDSLGNLVLQANCREEEFQATIEDQRTIITNQRETIQKTTEIVKEQQSFFGKLWGGVKTGLIILIILLVAIMAIQIFGNPISLLKRFIK